LSVPIFCPADTCLPFPQYLLDHLPESPCETDLEAKGENCSGKCRCIVEDPVYPVPQGPGKRIETGARGWPYLRLRDRTSLPGMEIEGHRSFRVFLPAERSIRRFSSASPDQTQLPPRGMGWTSSRVGQRSSSAHTSRLPRWKRVPAVEGHRRPPPAAWQLQSKRPFPLGDASSLPASYLQERSARSGSLPPSMRNFLRQVSGLG
jgi:hypothetical protein